MGMKNNRAGTNARAVSRNRAALHAFLGITPKERQAESVPPYPGENEGQAEKYPEFLVSVGDTEEEESPSLFEEESGLE